MTKILTYVSSVGYNPVSGETYPEAAPRYRSPREIYELLQNGFTVEERDEEGNAFLLDPASILAQFKDEIIPNLEEPKKGGKK